MNQFARRTMSGWITKTEKAMPAKSSPEQPEDMNGARLREDFRHFDRNRDGLMEFDEFVQFLGALDAGMSQEECRIGFLEIDTDHDNAIQFAEFVAWWGAV